ncbi:MAG: hypothetical protein HYR63_11595 [Proteobacteria bacterium]|nr:hypothetical protein [Pseudomonadota bacterium]MBI3496361.1 hypothetical protein [Pseudomonadota bacterium]
MSIDGRPLDPSTLEVLWALRRLFDPATPPLDAAMMVRLHADWPRRQKEYELGAFKAVLFSAFTAARSAGLSMDYATRYAARRAQRAAAALTMSEMLAELRGLALLS